MSKKMANSSPVSLQKCQRSDLLDGTEAIRQRIPMIALKQRASACWQYSLIEKRRVIFLATLKPITGSGRCQAWTIFMILELSLLILTGYMLVAVAMADRE